MRAEDARSRARAWTTRAGDLASLAALAGASLAAYWLAGWRIRAHVGFSDLAAYFLPKYQYVSERIAAGSLPLWNPLEFGGIPLLATLQPAVLYPPVRIVHAILEGEAAHIALFLLHLAVGALGAFALLRSLGCSRWPSALAGCWILEPLSLVRSYDNPVLLTTAAWTPLLVYLSREVVLRPRRRAILGLGVVAALQFLIGYPFASLAAAYLLALGIPFWLLERGTWERRHLAAVAVGIAAAAVLAALLVAAQLLPAAELFLATDRGREVEVTYESLLRLEDAHPGFLARGGFVQPTFSGCVEWLWSRFGPLVLVPLVVAPLAARAPIALWYGIAAVALTALSPRGVYQMLPFYEYVRFGAEWAALASFAVFLSCALALDALLRRLRPPRGVAAGAAIVILASTWAWSWRQIDPRALEPRRTVPARIPADVVEACGLADARFRAFWPSGQARAALLSARVASIAGYEQALLPARNAALMRALQIGNGGLRAGWADSIAAHREALSRMSLRCVFGSRAPVLEEAGLVRSRGRESGTPIYVNPSALPRARIVREAVWAESAEEARERFLRGAGEVVLERDERGIVVLPACTAGGEDSVVFERDEPEEVSLRTRSACPGYLVLADSWAASWVARINGERVPILVADSAFRAVVLPAGENLVVFSYEPRSVLLGAALSLVGLAILLAAWLAPRAAAGPRPAEVIPRGSGPRSSGTSSSGAPLRCGTCSPRGPRSTRTSPGP